MPNLTDIRKGLEIIAAADPTYNWISAEHDVICAPEVELSPEQEAQMEELGWFISDELECWAAFV